MVMASRINNATYIADLLAWRQQMEVSLRAEDSWLSLAGLHWLAPQTRMTIGADAACDITLPAGDVPAQLGFLTLIGDSVLLEAHSGATEINGNLSQSAMLRPDTAEDGPTLVTIGSVTFYVIQRGDQFAIRVRDLNNPARLAFTGRRWFAPNLDYRVTAIFTPAETPRTLTIINSVGLAVPMSNPGSVAFTLHGRVLGLEAFASSPGKLWFIFKDLTNGAETYGAGRFLTVPLAADNSVDLDFNRAYSPPCAFTEYATCPLAPKENHLPVRIEAGEMD